MVPQFAHTEIHDRHEFPRPVCRGADLQTGDVVPIEFLPETPGDGKEDGQAQAVSESQ